MMVARWEVTFQSVDRRTHECYWFLSRQRHLDGRLRDHQQQWPCSIYTCGREPPAKWRDFAPRLEVG